MPRNLPAPANLPRTVRIWLWLFPGSVTSTTAHRWVYLGLATVLSAAQVADLVQWESTFDEYFALCLFWVALNAVGFHAIAGGLIYTALVGLFLASGYVTQVGGLPIIGIYAISAEWISRRWNIPAACLLVLVEIIWFALTGTWFIPGPVMIVSLAATIALGLTLRRHQERLAQAKAESAANLAAAENAKHLVRRELGVELHDTLAKDLARIAITAQRLATSETCETPVSELHELAELAATAVRRLRPIILDLDASERQTPLPQVIETCTTMLRSRRITLATEVPDNIDITLTQQQRMLLGLILREATTNVLKYAPEKSIANLEIETEHPEVIALTLTNPIACGPVPTAVTGGFGLANLTERVTTEGGTLNFGRNDRFWVLAATLPSTPNLPSDDKEPDA